MVEAAISGTADRVFERLVSGLEAEFGSAAAEGLARVFVEAEGGDFYWEAREKLRWLGLWESLDEEREDALDRLAVAGILDGRCYVAVLLVDSRDAVQVCSECGISRTGRRRTTPLPKRIDRRDRSDGSGAHAALLPCFFLGAGWRRVGEIEAVSGRVRRKQDKSRVSQASHLPVCTSFFTRPSLPPRDLRADMRAFAPFGCEMTSGTAR